MEPLILRNIEKRYGKKQVLNGISLALDEGIFGLLGPNGAGKTTLMRMIAAIIRPDRGDIRFGEIRWSEHPEKIRQMIGYLPQDFHAPSHLTVHECLDYIAQLKGIASRSDRMNVIGELLERVNLAPHARLKTGKLSGGMRRRLGIAQALIGDPKILIVDEPTAELDPEERIRFRNLLRENARNRIVILSTHIVEDIASTCKSAAVLHRGKLRVFDQLDELAALADGQVWHLTVSHDEFRNLSVAGEIISSKIYRDRIELRIWNRQRPGERATPADPTIEEGYMTCING